MMIIKIDYHVIQKNYIGNNKYIYIFNIMKYLKEFVIGSCGFITIPYFISVNHSIQSGRAKYNYYDFTMFSPIGLGLWNVGSLIISDYFNLSKRFRFFITSVVHTLTTIIFVYYNDLYTFIDDKKESMLYFIKLFMTYLIHWNIVIYNLEKYI